MAPKEIDEVEDRIAELQSALDDLESTLGRLHETIDLIEPQDGAEIDLDAAARTAGRDDATDVIDLRTTDDVDV